MDQFAHRTALVGATPSTPDYDGNFANHYFLALRSFFRWLVADRRIAENPLVGLKLSRMTDADKRRRRYRNGSRRCPWRSRW